MKLGVGIFFFHAKLLAFSGAGCSFWYLFCQFFVIFSCKTSGFCGGGCSFWYLFCQFFVIFSCTISVFWEAGRSFRVKKDSFFHTKLRIFRGWMLFLVPFLSFLCNFFMQNFGFLRGWVVFSCKKYIFFMQNISLCGVGWSFWYLFCYFCVLLFKLNRIIFKKEIYLSILKLGFCCGLNPSAIHMHTNFLQISNNF